MFLLLSRIPLVSSIYVFFFFFITHPISHLHFLWHRYLNSENELESALTPSHAVIWSWEVGGFVRIQIANCHRAVRLGLPSRVGWMALVHSLIFLFQRIDLEIKQASLYNSMWHSKTTSLLILMIRLNTSSFSKYPRAHFISRLALAAKEKVKFPSQEPLYRGSHFNVSSAFLPLPVNYLVHLLNVIGIN